MNRADSQTARSNSSSRPLKSARRMLRRLLPDWMKAALRRPYDMLLEGFDRVIGRHDPLVPPARLMFVGGTRRDFRSLGNKWVQTFVRVADLKPHETVLDVGCGN